MSKSKSTLLHKLAIVFVVVFFISAVLYFLYDRYVYPSNVKYYKDFGIRIPENYQIHGIDVSKYQRNIHWDVVKKMQSNQVKIGFAFMRATIGCSRKDGYFNKNWSESKNANIPRGAYHYFYCNENSKLQALNFINNVELSSGDLPPVLDIEETNGVSEKQFKKQIKEWLDIVEEHYHVKPIIYTYTNFYEDFLSDDFDDYPFWIAHYNRNNHPSTSRLWHFWQHNEGGHVNGINANVDFNVFNGDSAAFNNILLK